MFQGVGVFQGAVHDCTSKDYKAGKGSKAYDAGQQHNIWVERQTQRSIYLLDRN